MSLKNNIKYIATPAPLEIPSHSELRGTMFLGFLTGPAKVFMTILILLFALWIFQFIIVETERTFAFTRIQEPKPMVELTQEEKRINRIRDSEKEFLPDGTIHLINELKGTPNQTDESKIVQIYDTNDNLLWQGQRNKISYEYLSWAESLDTHSYDKIFTLQEMKQIQMSDSFQNIEIPISSSEKTEQIWRYYPDKDYFIGYDTEGKKIGYISSVGFTESKANAKSFGKFRLLTAWCPKDSYNLILLWQTQRRIYQINFEKRQVDMLFESVDYDIQRISLLGWRDLMPSSEEYVDREKYRPLLYCETEDSKNHLIMRQPEQLITITVPEDWENWFGNFYQFTATRQNIFLYRRWVEANDFPDYRKSPKLYEQWRRKFRSHPQKYWVQLYKVDNNGNFESLNRYTWTVPGRTEPAEFTGYRMVTPRIVNKFSTPLYDLAWHLSGIKFWTQLYQRTELAHGFARMINDIRPGDSIINWLLSAAMMGFALWHGWPRRTSWLKFLFWLAFVGIFNLTGLLTYLALNHTAVIKCSVCGRCRGLIQVNCVRCGAELPTPKRGKLDLIFNT